MASRALDKLINTLYRHFSESNFLLCKQTVCIDGIMKRTNNTQKINLWNERLRNMCVAVILLCLLVIMMANIMMLLFQRTNNRKTHTHTDHTKTQWNSETQWDLCQRCKKHCAKVCDERIFIYKSNIGVNCPSVFLLALNGWLCCVNIFPSCYLFPSHFNAHL